jgi:hypothetical protein
MGLKFKHILLHHDIYFCIFINLHLHFLYFNCDWPLQIIFQFTGLFNIGSRPFNFILELFESLELFSGRFNNFFRNNLNQSLRYPIILIGHVVTNLLSFNFKHTHLNFLNYLLPYLLLPLFIQLNFLFDLADLFGFVQLHPLQLFLQVQNQELLILRVFREVSK